MSEDVHAKPDLTSKVRYGRMEREVEMEERGEREERINDIYISADDPDPGTQQDAVQRNTAQEHHGGSGESKKNRSIAAAVCLGLLCLLQLAVITGLVIHNCEVIKEKNNMAKNLTDLTDQKEQLETRYNLTTQKTQLQTSLDQLQSKCNNLTKTKNFLQTNFNNLQSKCNNLTETKNFLQTKFNQLQSKCNNLTKTKDLLQTKFGQLQSKCNGSNNNPNEDKNLKSNLKRITEERDFLFNNGVCKEDCKNVCGSITDFMRDDKKREKVVKCLSGDDDDDDDDG